MAELPTGTVTFLFTDIEGSVQLWEAHPEAMSAALARHDALLRAAIEAHGGHVFKTVGDQFCAVFATVPEAVAAALAAQRALLAEEWGETGPVSARMAVHTGAAEMRDEDYFGAPVNRVARLLIAGHGGQVLLSQAAADRIGPSLADDTRLRLLGVHRLRDITMRETIFQLLKPGLPSDFPPLNTLDVAFRRGLMRATAVSLVVIAVMAGLLGMAITMAHRERVATAGERQARLGTTRLLALDQTEHGVQQLEAGNGLGLLDLVEARRTAEPLPDLKEAIATVWAGWHQACAGRLINAVGHDHPVWEMKFSPDGTRLATASVDGTVQLWNTRTWEPTSRPLPNDVTVRIVLFSPDGKLLATVSETRVRLWNAATGEPIGGPLKHEYWVTSVAFSRDAKLLVSGCGDGTVRLWDTKTGQPRGRPLRPDGNSVPSSFRLVLVGFGPPPDNALVTATWGSVSLWNPATGQRSSQLLLRKQPSSTGPALAFSRDGTVRAIASDRMVWLWDPAERRFRSDLIHDPGTVGNLALSADGRLLATAQADKPAVRLWETSTGKASVPSLFHPASAVALAFGPPGSKLLVTLSGGVVRFWNTTTGQSYPDPPPTPAGVTALALALSPDGRTLASAAANGAVQLWALAPQPLCRQLPLPSGVKDVAPVEGVGAVATYSADGLRLWSAETEQLLSRPAGISAQPAAAFSQDGRFLVEWGGRSITVRETRTGQPHGPPLHLPKSVDYAALSSHGAVLVTMTGSTTLELWDAATGRPRGEPLRHRTQVLKLEFSPDESLLAAAEGGNIYLWETATGRLHVPPIRLAGTPPWVAFSPDCRTLAAVSENGGAVTLWSTATGRPYRRPLAHPAPVERGAFSPDGKLLAIVTNENTVRLWDQATGRLSGKPMPHPDEVLALQFSPDGKRLATASMSGARLWDVATCQAMSRALVPTGPVWKIQFGLNGRVLALSAGRAGNKAYLWRLPAPPASLAAMEIRTAIARGVAPRPGGSWDLLSWREWRELRRKAMSFDAEAQSAPSVGRRALYSTRAAHPQALAAR